MPSMGEPSHPSLLGSVVMILILTIVNAFLAGAEMAFVSLNPAKIKDMADAIDKLIDMQAEINRDIDRLIDLKREIASVISRVDKHDYRTLLERRYLGFETWDKIAAAMGYSIQHVYRLRDKALAEVQVPIKTGESM